MSKTEIITTNDFSGTVPYEKHFEDAVAYVIEQNINKHLLRFYHSQPCVSDEGFRK
jgi:hypothetical protein